MRGGVLVPEPVPFSFRVGEHPRGRGGDAMDVSDHSNLALMLLVRHMDYVGTPVACIGELGTVERNWTHTNTWNTR